MEVTREREKIRRIERVSGTGKGVEERVVEEGEGVGVRDLDCFGNAKLLGMVIGGGMFFWGGGDVPLGRLGGTVRKG